jgi:chemotaxis signal transduction protein
MSADDELQRILHARAVTLATPPAQEPATDFLELVVFRAGTQRYAIDAIEAEEAIEIGAITPLPGVPPLYRGLIVHQGVVYPLVDVRPLAGASMDDAFEPAHAILFSAPERTLAIAAEAVESFVKIDAATLEREGIVRLDVHLLLGDARLVIDDRPTIADEQVING